MNDRYYGSEPRGCVSNENQTENFRRNERLSEFTADPKKEIHYEKNYINHYTISEDSMTSFGSAIKSAAQRSGYAVVMLLLATMLGVLAPPSLKSQITLATPTATPLCFGNNIQLNSSVTHRLLKGRGAMNVNAFAWVGQNAGGANGAVNQLVLGDDELSGEQNPALVGGGNFVFNMYGEIRNLTADGFYVSSNGFITFINNALATGIIPQAIPNVAAPNHAIYILNTDLDPVAGGNIWWQVQDYGAGDQRLVVTFQFVPYVNPFQANLVNIQVIIYSNAGPNPSRITWNIQDAPVVAGIVGTAGIENFCGSVATAVPGRNNAAMPGVAANISYNNDPLDGPTNASVSVEFFDNAGLIATVAAAPNPPVGAGATAVNYTHVSPAVGNHTYTATVTYTYPCGITETASGSLPGASTPMVVVALPTVKAITSPTPVCGSPTSTASVTPENATNTYTWSSSVPANVTSFTPNGTNGAASTTIAWNNAVLSPNGSTFNLQLTEAQTIAPFCVRVQTPVAVTVYQTPASPVVTGAGIGTVPGALGNPCPLNPTVYTQSATGGTSNYQWVISGAPAGTTVGGFAVSGGGVTVVTTANTISITWGNTTTNVAATVVATASNGTGGSAGSPGTLRSCAGPASASTTVNINGVPAAETPVVNIVTSVCAGDNRTYTLTLRAGSTYAWTVTPGVAAVNWTITTGVPPNNNSATINWILSGSYTVNCTETTAGGCIRVHTGVPVTVNPIPAPVWALNPAVGCTYIGGPIENGQNLVQYTYTVTPTSSTNRFDWTVSNGIFVETGTSNRTNITGVSALTSTVRWSAAGVNIVTVTETIVATGCAKTLNQNSTVTASPTPRSIAGPGYVTVVAANPCAGTGPHVYQLSGVWANTNLFAVSMVNNGVISVALNPANGQFSVTYNAAVTTARIRVTETTAPGTACVTEREFDITVNPLPTGNVTPATTQVCNGNTAVFTFNATGGTVLPGATYSWTTTTPANVTYIGSIINPSVTAQGVNAGPGIAAGNIICTVTNPGVGGCSVQFNATLQVVPTPTTAAPTVPTPVCVGGTYAYVANGSAYPGGGVTRSWTVTITPVAAYTGSAVVVIGPTVSNLATFNFNATIGDSSLANVLTAGTYTITTTFTDVLGAASCTTVPNVTAPLTVNTRPVRPVVDFVTPVCAGNYPQGYSITNYNGAYLYQTGAGTTAGIVITLLGGGGTTNGTAQTLGAAPAISVTNWGAAGTKTVQIDATDPVGCLRRTVYTLVVVAAPANPQPAPTPQTNACIDSQYFANPVAATFAVNPTAQKYTYAAPTPLANHWYQWYVTNGFIVNGGNISQGTNTTATLNQTSIQVVWTGATPGKVKYLVFTSDPAVALPAPCFATSIEPNINLPIIPNWPLTFTTSIVGLADICEGAIGTVQLSGSKVGLTYRVEEWNGATWSNVAAVTQVAGTGAAINITIPASVLTSVNPAPTCTHHDLRVTSMDLAFVPAGGACNWTRTSVTGNVDYHVFDKPNDIPVVNNTPITCDVDNVTLTVGTAGQPSQPTVLYTLERSTIPAGVWTNIQTLSGNNGALTMTDNSTAGIGSTNSLLNADNYQYRVTGAIDPTAQCNAVFPPGSGCATTMTQIPTARIFADPLNPTVTFVPNPVCWESNITVDLASTQAGVRYEVKVGATSLSPVQYIFGDGNPKNLVFNSTLIQAANPSNFVVINNVNVQAVLISNGTYPRQVPPSGCPATYGSTNITVNEKPVASISGSAVACGPSTANYTAAAVTPSPTSTFDWRIEPVPGAPSGTTPMTANNTGNLTVNPYTVNWGVHLLNCDGTYNPFAAIVRLIATNSHGCTDTAFHNVTVQPTVNDAAISGDLQACIYGGFEAHLKTYTIARPGVCVFPTGTTYLWAMPVGTVSGTIRSGQNTTSIISEWNTTGGTGIGTVSCTVTLPITHGGCATTSTFDVQVYPLPVPVVNGPASVCQNQAGTIYTADIYATDTYNWQVVGGTIVGGAGAGTIASPATRSGVNLNTITVNWLDQANQNAYVRLTQVSAVGCMNVTNFFVTVNPTPTPSINGADLTCDNSVYTYSTANNAPTNSYQWTVTGNATITGGPNQATSTVLTGAIGGGASFTLTLTETIIATTCTKTVNKVVTILQKPNPSITRVSPAGGSVGGACLNQSITYGNSDPVAASPSYSYLWTVANGSIVGSNSAATVQVTWNTVGTGSVSLAKWHTGSQCTTSVSQSVTIVNPPAPAISGPLAVCGTSTQTYSTANIAGNTYEWSILANGTITAGGTTNAAVVLFDNPTPGGSLASTISVVETNTLSGCVGNANVVVAIRYQPQVATVTRVTPVGAANQACNNDVITYSIPTNTGSTYQWTVTGGTISSGATTPTVTLMWTNVGTQTLTVVEKDATGNCSATSVLNVGVTYKPTPSISGNATPCTGQTYTYSTANVAGSTYAWSLPLFGGNITSGVNSNTITVEWTLSGARSVEVTETNGLCTATTTLNVTVGKTPTTTTIARTSPVGTLGQACNGQTITYTTPNNGTSTYLWTVTGGTITGANNTNAVSVQWTVLGNQTLTVLETTIGTTCSKTAVQTVAVEDQPAPTIAGPTPICSGTNGTYSVTAVAGHTYNWSISGGGTIISSTTASTLTVNWTTAGSQTVTVVQGNATGNCTATANLTVVVDQTPAQTSIAGAATVCNGTSQAYSVTSIAGQTYVWTVTGGNITAGAGTNAITVQWTALGSQTVSVNISTTGTVCTKTLSQNIAVEFQPNPVITGPAVVCTGSSYGYSTPSNAGSSYAWTVTGGTITSGAASSSITVLWTASGNQTVSVTETNSTGNCFKSTSLVVSVGVTPTTTAISRTSPAGSVGQACQGETITYTTPSNAGSSYLWTATGGSFVGSTTTNQAVVTWNVLGTQTLTVVETTTGTNCSKTAVQNVSVTYKPTPNISGAFVVCTNKIHTYTTPAVSGSNYVWTITPTTAFANISGYPNSHNITVQWIQPGLHTITLTETNGAGGCFTTVTQQILVNDIPTPFITSTTGYGNPVGRRPGIVCALSNHTYAVTATPGNVFNWTVVGGSIVTGQNTSTINVTWGGSGLGSIAVTETVPGSDCRTTKRDTIDIRPKPTPNVTGQVNPCGGSVQVYTTPLVAGNSYLWTVVGGSFVQTSVDTIQVTWQSPVWPNTIAGSVSVTEWVTDVLPNQSCLTSFTLNTTVRPNPPVPTITGSAVICATDSSTTPITVNVGTYTSSNPGSVTFNWTVSSNGTIVGGQGSTVLSVEWANASTVPTTGSVNVTHTSTFGCTSSASFAVTINPLPKPAITGVRSVCQNAIHTYSTPGLPGNAYVWTLTGGNIIRSGQGTPNIIVEWTLPGTYTLTVTETNTFGCVVSNAIAVTVNALPTAKIAASGLTTFCQGGDVTLTAPIGFASYVWSTGNTGRSIVVRSTGTYWVRVTDANGCSNSSDTLVVNVFPSTLPIITVNAPTTFCEDGSVTLTAPAGFSAYLWSTGQSTQSIVVTKTGTYTVTIADGNGCTGTSTEVDVFVNPKPAPVLTVIGATNICNGDSVEVRAPAGYVSYTWTSKTGVTYPATRTIKVTQSDTVVCRVVDLNGCIGTSDTVKVKMNPIIKPVVMANGPTTFCSGSAVTLSAPAGYATYLWSNGATTREIIVKDGGNYKVVAANQALCQIESSITTVVVNDLPIRPTISRRGDTLTVTSLDATTYQWYRDGNVIVGAVNVKLVVGLPGVYNVGIADLNTCASVSDDYEVVLTNVEDDIVAGRGAELRVFPNPTSGQFTVETVITEAGPVRIELVNAVGELVLTANEMSNGGQFRTSLTMGELASGVYNVVVTTGNHRWTVRLVRQ